MRKDRLRRLADLIETETLRKDHSFQFDMNAWGKNHTANTLSLHDCNTACCAMGLAALSGAFRAEGLDCYYIPAFRGVKIRFTLDGFGGADGFSIAERFFEIEREQALYLFAPLMYECGNNPHPSFVAKRIRDFVDSNGESAR